MLLSVIIFLFRHSSLDAAWIINLFPRNLFGSFQNRLSFLCIYLLNEINYLLRRFPCIVHLNFKLSLLITMNINL